MTEQQENSLQSIGKCAMDSIRDMIAAMQCDYDRLAELRELQDSITAQRSDDTIGSTVEVLVDAAGLPAALAAADGNLSRAADLLGIHRNTLSRKVTDYRLQR